MRAWFSDVSGLGDAIELCYDKAMLPGYGWIFPAGERRANVGVYLLPRFSDQRSTKRLFESFVNDNAFATAKLQRAVMEPGTLKSRPLTGNDESAALPRYEQLWRGEFSGRVCFPGNAFLHFMNNRWFVDTFIRHAAKKQHRADFFADVVAHKRKRRELFKLLNPLY